MRTDRPANIVGRVQELAEASTAMGRVPAGATGVLVRGAAGIGKSTVWQAAVDEAVARGWRVLAARPAAAESELSFAGLADLLTPVTDAALADLPKPQRQALEVALLHESAPDEPPDARTTAVAVLGALRSLS